MLFEVKTTPFLPVLPSTVVNYTDKSLTGCNLGSRESERLLTGILKAKDSRYGFEKYIIKLIKEKEEVLSKLAVQEIS